MSGGIAVAVHGISTLRISFRVGIGLKHEEKLSF